MPIILSFFSGLVTALTLPTVLMGFHFPDLGFLAWFSIIPFYLSLKSKDYSSFLMAFAFACAFYSVNTEFLTDALYQAGQINYFTSLIYFIFLVLILSTIFSLFILGAVQITKKGVPLWMSLPVAWVSFDFFRNYFPFGGIPWAGIAYTQHSFSLLIQILDIVGIYGVVFLVIFSNALGGETIYYLKQQRLFPRWPLLSFLILFLSSLIYGSFRELQIEGLIKNAELIRIALIQGNSPQRKNWPRDQILKEIQNYLALSAELFPEKPDLIVWPEVPHPGTFKASKRQINFLSEFPIPLVFNFLIWDGKKPARWPPTEEELLKYKLYNSALLTTPGGDIVQTYRKMHLVPFGEYVPFRQQFKFLKPLVPEGNFYSPGDKLELFAINFPGRSAEVLLGVSICAEDMFPNFTASMVRKGANILINLTNTGWYGISSAPFQHFEYSRYRAIESRRSLARATNSGLTAFFSPTGEIIGGVKPFQKAKVIRNIPIMTTLSLYSRYGDIFAKSLFGFYVFLLIMPGALLCKRSLGSLAKP